MSVQYFFSFDKISRTENPINFKAKQNTHKKKSNHWVQQSRENHKKILIIKILISKQMAEKKHVQAKQKHAVLGKLHHRHKYKQPSNKVHA